MLNRLESLIAGPAYSTDQSDWRKKRVIRFDKVALLEAVADRLDAVQRSTRRDDTITTTTTTTSISELLSLPTVPPSTVASYPSSSSAELSLTCRKVACTFCHQSKLSCDGGRPCRRCVRAQREEQCVNRVWKRARGRDEVQTGGGDEEKGMRWSVLPVASESDWPHSTIPYLLHPHRPLPLPPSRQVVTVDLSRCLYTVHVDWFRSHNTPGGRRWPVCLREKFVYWESLSTALTVDEMTELVFACFSFAGHRSVAHHGDALTTTVGVSSLFHQHSRCSTCRCFLSVLRRGWDRCPCSTSWGSSPHSALADWTDAPNFPLLTLSCLITEEALRDEILHVDALADDEMRSAPSSPPAESQGQWQDSSGAQRVDGTLSEAFSTGARASLGCQWYLWESSPPFQVSPSIQGESTEHGTVPVHPFPSSAVVSSTLGGVGMLVSMSAQVNSAFERFLGYTQAEVRLRFIAEGERGYYALVHPSSWEQLMAADLEARVERRRDYQLTVRCRNKWRTDMPCLLHCTLDFGARGTLLKRKFALIPL